MKNYFLWIGLALMWMTGCTTDSLEELVPSQNNSNCGEVSFANDILPLMEKYCNTAGCHDGSNPLVSDLRTYDDILPVVDTIKSYVQSGYMPVGERLTSDEIQLFVTWIDKGAFNN